VPPLITTLRKDSSRRPPAWRWQRVGMLLEDGRRNIRRDRDQDQIAEIFRFRKLLERCQTDSDHMILAYSAADLYEAWSSWEDDDQLQKWELEARLLSGEPYEAIAQKLCLTRAAVTAYERYFFNVSDRLDAPGYITHQVLGESVQAGLAERAFDTLWKMFGYWCGHMPLDHLAYKFNKPSRPETIEGVEALWMDDISSTLKMRTAIAARITPINWQTGLEILNVYFRMLEMEKGLSSGGGGNESILDNVQSLFGYMPWTKQHVGVAAQTHIEQHERGGAIFRAAELSLYGATGVPTNLQHLMSSAQYPNTPGSNDEQT